MQGHVFNLAVNLLVLKASDVVFGCEWLQKLGDIISNFKKLTMIFTLPNGDSCHLVEDCARGPKQGCYSLCTLDLK